MHRANLEKLAAYLETLPSGYEHFSMFDYCNIHGWASTNPTEADTVTACGTVACAIGHGPSAGIPPRPGEDWDDYESRVFQLKNHEWMWCFSSNWVSVDNTPQGAAKRIRYMLEHGVPQNSAAQEYGEAGYIFAADTHAS